MKKVFTLLSALFITLSMLAAGAVSEVTMDALSHDHECGPKLVGLDEIPVDDRPVSKIAKAEADETTWSEWELYGTIHFPEYIRYSLMYMAEDAPEWTDGTVEVFLRHNVNDADEKQIRFDGLLGNDTSVSADIVDSRFVSDEVETGISIADEYLGYGYETYRISLTGRAYLELGVIKITSMWMPVGPEYGFQFTNVEMVVDGYELLSFSLGGAEYISSATEPKATLEVEGSEEIAICRVVVAKRGETVYINDVEDLMNFDVLDPVLSYTDYVGRSFTIDLGEVDEPTTYMIVALPFSSEGKSLGLYVTKTIYVNRPDKHSWTSLGKGTVTEILGHIGLSPYDYYDFYNGEVLIGPSTHEVEIEEASDLPGLYRLVNPFSEDHPLAESFTMTNPGEDFYLYVDVTDPSHGYIPLSYVGFNTYDSGVPGYVLSTSYSYAGQDVDDSWSPFWGKLVDNRITFPAHSVYINNTHVTFTPDNELDMEIILPDGSNRIDTVIGDGDSEGTAEYYNLQGERVANPSGGIFIRRQGSSAEKVYIR